MKAYDEPLAESHTKTWGDLDRGAIHGEVFFAVSVLAEHQAQQAAPTTLSSRAVILLGAAAVFEQWRVLLPATRRHLFPPKNRKPLMDLPGLELKIRMTLMAGPDTRVFVPVRLYYTDSDPYAVQFSFDVTPDAVVRWTFARDLLEQGLIAPAGIGDVKITPIDPHRTRGLGIELESPGGYARLEAPAASVKAWLAKTYEVVPAGQESEFVDIDSFLDKLRSH
ncbi:SsgA family sporulation/cell division regulator [Streptomyces sp. NPDC058417]|uniref:SsgA family sporulation/cell division regulator n=1 Tax=unclassified Streptomyces TaxID=2593676 RepID=UPI00364A9512